jgi:type II secretory pathway pseudopilin PulG
MNSIYKFIKNRNGYSLFELNIAMVIFGIIGLVAIGIIGGQTRNFVRMFNRSFMISQGRNAINILRTDSHNLPPDSISVMQSNQLKFININGQTIEYLYQSSKLSRNKDVLASDLSSGQFFYLDINKNVTASSANLCYIKINLTFSKGSENVVLEELIHARN